MTTDDQVDPHDRSGDRVVDDSLMDDSYTTGTDRQPADTDDASSPGPDRPVVTVEDSDADSTVGVRDEERAPTRIVSPAEEARADEARREARAAERNVIEDENWLGGMKIGSAFFGWVTAFGMAAILAAILTAAGAVINLTDPTALDDATAAIQDGTSTAQTITVVGAIVLAIALFVAYYCGGYVAGRMARLDGARQGLAVWLWGVVMAIVVAVAAAVFGTQYDVLAQFELPRLPINNGTLTTSSIIALIVAAVVMLVAAVLGGMAGMRYHRKVDAASERVAEVAR
jgi:hypothetical protein